MPISYMTLQQLVTEVRLQLKRYIPSEEFDNNEMVSYINTAYVYYLNRMGFVKESNMVERATAIDIVAGTYEYSIPTTIASVTAVIIVYGGMEYYLWRKQNYQGVRVGSGGINVYEGWSPTVKFIKRKIHLLPAPTSAITGGLVFEGTIYPAILSSVSATISSEIPANFQYNIILRAVMLALKSSKETENFKFVQDTLNHLDNMFDELGASSNTIREVVDDLSGVDE